MEAERLRDGLRAGACQPLEGRGRHLLEREVEDVTVSAEALEGPGEVGLYWVRSDSVAGRHDAQQHAPAVRALGLSAKSLFRRTRTLATFFRVPVFQGS
jgi:hypothetical protein